MTKEASYNQADRVHEQLQLWLTRPQARAKRGPVAGMTWADRLAELLREDLSFEGQNTSYSRHNFHAYAAKFPPQLPEFFIEELSKEGEVVLDPMVGSGTAVLEAALAKRRAIGFDIDPLAVRIARIKTMAVRREAITDACAEVVKKARAALLHSDDLKKALAERFDSTTLEFMDYWFLPPTQLELLALARAIEHVKEEGVRAFLEVAFSAAIVTKSGGVSMAMDLAHSRPHKVASKVPKHAIDQFESRVRKSLKSLEEPVPEGLVQVYQADARSLPLESGSVDLIVTSPPYANAIDYVRAHKFSLVWLGEPISKLAQVRSTYIGSEKASGEKLKGYGPISERVLEALCECDEAKARVFSLYLRDMSQALGEMLRVLRPGRCAIVVVGSSTMRQIDVRTQDCLTEAAVTVGWNVVGMAIRKIDRDKRLMPMRRNSVAGSQIEQRMFEEYVIGMTKPEERHADKKSNAKAIY